MKIEIMQDRVFWIQADESPCVVATPITSLLAAQGARVISIRDERKLFSSSKVLCVGYTNPATQIGGLVDKHQTELRSLGIDAIRVYQLKVAPPLLEDEEASPA